MVRIRSILILTTGAAGAAAVLVASPGTYEWLRRATGRASDRHHYETELAEARVRRRRASATSRRPRPTTCACRCARGSRRARATSRPPTPTPSTGEGMAEDIDEIAASRARVPRQGARGARQDLRRRVAAPARAQTSPGERSTARVAASCAGVDAHVARDGGRLQAAREAALEQRRAAPAALAEADELAAVRVDHLVGRRGRRSRRRGRRPGARRATRGPRRRSPAGPRGRARRGPSTHAWPRNR